MEFNIRPLKPSDYDDTLVKWWGDWGWTAPEKDFLPDNGEGGLMVLDGEIPVCAGFIYMTNSKVAWVEFLISNKEYRLKPNRQQAISLLIDTLNNIARNMGNKYCYSLLTHCGLIRSYERLGYVRGSSNSMEMIKIL